MVLRGPRLAPRTNHLENSVRNDDRVRNGDYLAPQILTTKALSHEDLLSRTRYGFSNPRNCAPRSDYKRQLASHPDTADRYIVDLLVEATERRAA
jgi:hypothetical protein